MKPPYLRRMDWRRRTDAAFGLFITTVYLALGISFARLLIHIAEHRPWL